MKTRSTPKLVYIIETTALSPSGEQVSINVGSGELTALANALDVTEVRNFKTDLRVSRWKKAGVQLSGCIYLKVVQPCIVSLEPVSRNIELDIQRRFLPLGKAVRKNERFEDGELILDPESDNEPDELVGGRFDLWEILIEEIYLNLDQFPRSESAENLESLVSEEVTPDPNHDQKAQLDPTHKPFSNLDTLIKQKKSET